MGASGRRPSRNAAAPPPPAGGDSLADQFAAKLGELRAAERHATQDGDMDEAARLREAIERLQAAHRRKQDEDRRAAAGPPPPPPPDPLRPAEGVPCESLEQRRRCTAEAGKGHWRQSPRRWQWREQGEKVCGLGYLRDREAAATLKGKRVLFIGGNVLRRTMYAVADIIGGTDAVRRGTSVGAERLHANDSSAMAAATARGATGVVMDSLVGENSGARVVVDTKTRRWGPDDPQDPRDFCGVNETELYPDPYLPTGGSGFDLFWDPQNARILNRKQGGEPVYGGSFSADVTFEMDFSSKVENVRQVAADALNELHDSKHAGVQKRHGKWVSDKCTLPRCPGPNGWTRLSITIQPPVIRVTLRIGGRVSEVTRLASLVEKAVVSKDLTFKDGYSLRGNPAVVRILCGNPPACRRTWNIFCPFDRAPNAPKQDAVELVYQRTDDVGKALEELAAMPPIQRVTHIGAGADLIVLQGDLPGDCERTGERSMGKVLHAVRRMNMDEAWPHGQTAWVWMSPTHTPQWSQKGSRLQGCWRDLAAEWGPKLLDEGHIALAPVSFPTAAGVHERALRHTTDTSADFFDAGRLFLAQAVLNAARTYWGQSGLCARAAAAAG
eukprot:TRINITY_DN16937_c0_g2_i1.p1 TRINITY_DN16937_c0_g2~~TRINITY_DN16937_c0_g2_i1.p1  ORF type:complete len:714 (+),score=206.69 TRINITY_DN16937_c0_g2_i1:309-2144(+)